MILRYFEIAKKQSRSSKASWTLRAALATAAVTSVFAATWSWDAVQAADRRQINRGKYLVMVAGCTDCHTPGHFLGQPDMKHFLGGSEVGFEIPGLGVFHGPNLTPDDETGLGKWSQADIVKALTTGTRPDGRELVPIMPWKAYAKLTKRDALAIAAYLQSLPPVSNKVPGPFGESQTPTAFVMKVVPPAKK